MQKEFTIAVPDEYWVDSWIENKTMTWTYEGPDKTYVLTNTQGEFILWQEEEIVRNEESLEKIKVVDADIDTDIAYFLVSQSKEHVYEYAEEINHDGSIYQFFTNPRIQDLFYLGTTDSYDLILKPIFKKTETIHETIVKKRKQGVLDLYDKYDVDDDSDRIIKEFLSKADAYLKKMEKVYPWKYVEIDDSDVPRLPMKLINVVNEQEI